MSPGVVIFYTALAAPIILLLIIAMFWRKARSLLLVLAVIISLGETYFVLYQQESSLQAWYGDEDNVNAYLEKIYPEDDWVSRQATRNALFPTGVEVIFIDEPTIAYLYIVEGGDVQLAGYSAEDDKENPKRSE